VSNIFSSWATWPLVLRVAVCVSVLALASSALLLLWVIHTRRFFAKQDKTEQLVLNTWRPLLIKVAMGEMVYPLPSPSKKEREPLLYLWNQLQDGLRGTAKHSLFSLAWQLGFSRFAWQLVNSKNKARKILGLATLGHLAQARDWERLLPVLKEKNAPVSLAAARALHQVDSLRAVPLIINQFLAHKRWPAASVATILKEADAAQVASALVQIIQSLPAEQQIRLIPLTRLAEGQGQRVISILLACSEEPNILAAALALVRGPTSYPKVIALTKHGNAQVRAYAAKALAQTTPLAQEKQTNQVLFSLLSDSQWSVRHRAAQTVVAQPFYTKAHLQLWLSQLKDEFAKDILLHAWAQARQDYEMREVRRSAPVMNESSLVGAI
jgi:HEAT repeat protein